MFARVLVLFLTSVIAYAQPPGYPNYPVASPGASLTIKSAQWDDWGRRMGEMLQSAGKESATRTPIEATDFAPPSKRMMDGAFLDALTKTEVQRMRMARAFAAAFSEYEKRTRKHNVAYAVAFVLLTAIEVKHRVDIPDDKLESVALAINDDLARVPSFQRLDAKSRQQAYEACILTATLMLLYRQANNAKVAAKLADQVLVNFGKSKPKPSKNPACYGLDSRSCTFLYLP